MKKAALAAALAMRLSSPAVQDGQILPRRYTCDGEDVSPPLRWSALPAGAQSLALIMEDPDAPAGTWVHWVVYDLPPGAGRLAEGLPKKASLANGARQGASWGVQTFERVGYSGPCPPPGKPHRYVFTLYALKGRLGLPPGATKDDVLKAMRDQVLSQAGLTARYGR